MNRIASTLLIGFSLVVACDCGDDGEGTDAADSPGDTTSMDGSTTTPNDGFVGVDSPFTTDPGSGCVVCPDGDCCACNNGIDDDGDGTIDGLDSECTGGYDDDEDTYSTGIPGDNVDFCQDCFFDGNSGAGDDGCAYHSDCLTTGMPPSGGGGSSCFDCEVSAECVDFCGPRTPNGCDCFGCCTVERDDGTTVDVVLASTCSLENIDDEAACPRCVKTPDCTNECGECELCLGKTEEDLPETCFPEDGGGGGYTCDNGEQVCSDTMPCDTGFYCQLGCCLPILI